jgi:hypothetical protein
MVTNNDDHPRNQALIRTNAGCRLSPAYGSCQPPSSLKNAATSQ